MPKILSPSRWVPPPYPFFFPLPSKRKKLPYFFSSLTLKMENDCRSGFFSFFLPLFFPIREKSKLIKFLRVPVSSSFNSKEFVEKKIVVYRLPTPPSPFFFGYNYRCCWGAVPFFLSSPSVNKDANRRQIPSFPPPSYSYHGRIVDENIFKRSLSPLFFPDRLEFWAELRYSLSSTADPPPLVP